MRGYYPISPKRVSEYSFRYVSLLTSPVGLTSLKLLYHSCEVHFFIFVSKLSQYWLIVIPKLPQNSKIVQKLSESFPQIVPKLLELKLMYHSCEVQFFILERWPVCSRSQHMCCCTIDGPPTLTYLNLSSVHYGVLFQEVDVLRRENGLVGAHGDADAAVA